MQILFEQKVKMRENCIESSLSIAFSSMSIFFPVGLDNAVRIHDKMQVVHKEMTCDRTKSNVAMWNLISRIQFNHMKNFPMFMWCNDWVSSNWTLDILFMVCGGM